MTVVARILPSQKRRHYRIGKGFLKDVIAIGCGNKSDGWDGFCRDTDTPIVQPRPFTTRYLSKFDIEFVFRRDTIRILVRATNG